MKFNHLQASISNNANQSPSLYMAFCAVESLFADLEDNCGAELSRCPVGDERLPSKLVWLCRVINEIYSNNDAELQRNRSRLDAAMEKLNETRQELEKSADVYERLENAKAEYAVLEQKLQNSGAAAEEYEKLSEKCRQAKQTLEQLGTFDFASAEAELKKMTDEIDSKENAKASLLAEINEIRVHADGLNREIAELQKEEKDAKNQLVNLQEQQQNADEENARLREEVNLLETKLVACTDERQQLIIQSDETQNNIDSMQKKISEFREENLLAKSAELEAVKEEMEQLEGERSAFEQECCQIEDKRCQLVMDIARKKAESESLAQKLIIVQQKRDSLEKEKLCLAANLSDCTQTLATLQSEVDILSENKLPEVKEMQEREQLRKAELQRNVNEAENQLNALQNEIKKLNEILPKLEEDVKNNRVVYDALSASCAASSSELESLERQIEELRNNTDEQKRVIYQKQLEEKMQELENVQSECERLKQETSEQGIKLEQLQEERARLRDLKNRHEQGVTVTQKQLRELEFVVNEEYIKEVTSLEDRLQLLEVVRGKLVASITNMQNVLGVTPVQETEVLEELLECDLRELRLRVDDLRSSLVKCAQSLKMEER